MALSCIRHRRLNNTLKGLAEAIDRNSKEKGINSEQALREELEEMEEFVKELRILGNKENKEKLVGIVYFGRAFYLSALHRSQENKIELRKAMNQEIEETINFLDKVDKIYYEELKGKVSNPLKELVKRIAF